MATESEGAPRSGCIVTGVAMPWLADTDVGAAYGFARSIVGAQTEAELQRRALQALAELVPADVLTWDRVELATGAIDHEATPAGAEPPGAFDALVGHAGDHPLLAAHAARRRPALRLSEVVEPGVAHPRRALRRPAARRRRGVRDRDRHAHRSRRGGRRRARAHRTRVLRARPRRARHRPPGARACAAGHAGARAPRPRARRRSSARHGGDAARPRRRDRTLQPRRRALAGRALRHRPTIPAGFPGRSPSGSRCRRARRWSASATAVASPSACSLAIRTHCCSRRPWRASARTPSTGSA